VKVFCSNCGTPTEGSPGASLTCATCGTAFEVPSDAPAPSSSGFAGPAQPQPESAPPPPPPRPFAEPPPPPSSGWAAPPPQSAQRAKPDTHPLAIVSLVSSLLCCIPVVAPAVALTCGFLAVGAVDRSHGQQTGKGLAVAGIVIAGFVLVIQLLVAIGNVSKW
jgi:hypothetical protein